jgi:transcriptional regulator with XRE-family HTH domain
VDAELVRRIRAARGYAGLSQPGLAQKLGVSKDTLARIERGERALRPLEERNFPNLVAEATGLPAEWFTVKDLGAALKFAAGMDEADAEYRRWAESEGVEVPDAGPDPVLEELVELRDELQRFRAAWDDLAVPAIGLIQAAAQERLDAEERASHGREAPEQSRPAERRAG